MKRLGVNIDHIATLRNARGEKHPDPIYAAKKVISYGADSVTIHLREIFPASSNEVIKFSVIFFLVSSIIIFKFF